MIYSPYAQGTPEIGPARELSALIEEVIDQGE